MIAVVFFCISGIHRERNRQRNHGSTRSTSPITVHERTAICKSQLEPIIENPGDTQGTEKAFGRWFADGLYWGLVSSATQASWAGPFPKNDLDLSLKQFQSTKRVRKQRNCWGYFFNHNHNNNNNNNKTTTRTVMPFSNNLACSAGVLLGRGSVTTLRPPC